MPESFEHILAQPTIFRDRNVLSPHYLPVNLPHREKEIEKIMRCLSPSLMNQKPRNLFLYGKTGTGKTSSTKYVLERLAEMKSNVKTSYLNCRIYNSRYRVMYKVIQYLLPKFAKSGQSVSYFYEKLLDWIEEDGKHVIIILDEIDMIKDLDECLYTLTRSNDDLKTGSISIIGISNKLSFKDALDPRSKSALCETELIFSPYNSTQLNSILAQRIQLGFKENVVDDSAISLAAAIAAQETGDARYALKLLLKAAEIVEDNSGTRVIDKHVELARRSVDEDIAAEAITTLPKHQQLVLYSIANLHLHGSKYKTLTNGPEHFLLSGEVYESYVTNSKKFQKDPRSARWFREYLNDLEMLGLITMIDSGKGQRGHTRFIKIAYSAEKVKYILEQNILGVEIQDNLQYIG
ncbi:AAA family ATPase [Candidatus Micrarchaeota archaeon]|nr:AAA family ATPase [Candidatus Micrarchaeota archaeon]